MDFKNKVVLITGASSGIGKQTAIEFAKLGSNIILVARRKNKLEQVENELKQFQVNQSLQQQMLRLLYDQIFSLALMEENFSHSKSFQNN